MMDRLISLDLLAKLNSLESFLGSHILGQSEVIHDITGLLQRSLCGLRFLGRPLASMLLLGGTGVGKTEIVNLFTQHLFEPHQFVRLDMSEYMTADSIGILRGRNTNENGLMGHYMRGRSGHGTILFDEIEKAHPLIMDVFLQILSAGRFTCANGDILDFSNYVVAATTNIGSRMLMESRSTDRETLIKRTLTAGTQEMRPETFARFDLHCVFNKLDYEVLRKIGELHVAKTLEIFNAQGHDITVDPSMIEYIQREGYSEQFGARPIQSAAMRIIGGVVSAEILKNGGNRVNLRIWYAPVMDRCLYQNA